MVGRKSLWWWRTDGADIFLSNLVGQGALTTGDAPTDDQSTVRVHLKEGGQAVAFVDNGCGLRVFGSWRFLCCCDLRSGSQQKKRKGAHAHLP